MTLSRHNLFGIGVGAALLAALALAAANFLGDAGENGGVGPYVFTLGVSIAIAAARVRLGDPAQRASGSGGDRRRGARHPLAARVLDRRAVRARPCRRRPRAPRLRPPAGKGAAVVAIVLGSLATVAAVAAVIIDQST